MNPIGGILIVEDEYLIASDLADFLQENGFEVIGTVPSVKRAFECIGQRMPIAAILDIKLGNELSFPIADRLAELGVPFMFFTSSARRDLPDRFTDRPMISKLENLAAVRAALEDLIGHMRR